MSRALNCNQDLPHLKLNWKISHPREMRKKISGNSFVGNNEIPAGQTSHQSWSQSYKGFTNLYLNVNELVNTNSQTCIYKFTRLYLQACICIFTWLSLQVYKQLFTSLQACINKPVNTYLYIATCSGLLRLVFTVENKVQTSLS